jgi:hypothetical protein
MGCAEVIALSAVRASSQGQRLRHDLQARLDQWLDRLQAQLPMPQAPWAEVTEAVWNLRQDLTGGLRGYPETLLSCHCDIKQHSCGNAIQDDHKVQASSA